MSAAASWSLRSIDVSPILIPIPPNIHKRKLLSFNSPRNSRVCVSRSSSGNHEYKQLKNKEEISNAGGEAIFEELLEDYEDEIDDLSCLGVWSWKTLSGLSMLSAGNALFVWSSWRRLMFWSIMIKPLTLLIGPSIFLLF